MVGCFAWGELTWNDPSFKLGDFETYTFLKTSHSQTD